MVRMQNIYFLERIEATTAAYAAGSETTIRLRECQNYNGKNLLARSY